MTAPQTPAVPPPAAGSRTPAGAQTPSPAGVTREITPLDPNSDKGRDIAARLSVVFADVRQAIASRAAANARRTNP